MPKTPIDIDCGFIFRQYNIRFTRIPFIIFSETKAFAMKKTSNYDFRFGILAANM